MISGYCCVYVLSAYRHSKEDFVAFGMKVFVTLCLVVALAASASAHTYISHILVNVCTRERAGQSILPVVFFFARKSCVVLGRCLPSFFPHPSRGWGEVLGVLLPQPPPGAHLRAGRRASHRVSTHGRGCVGLA